MHCVTEWGPNWVHLIEGSARNRSENTFRARVWARCSKTWAFMFASLFYKAKNVSGNILILLHSVVKFPVQLTTIFQLPTGSPFFAGCGGLLGEHMNKMWLFKRILQSTEENRLNNNCLPFLWEHKKIRPQTRGGSVHSEWDPWKESGGCGVGVGLRRQRMPVGWEWSRQWGDVRSGNVWAGHACITMSGRLWGE